MQRGWHGGGMASPAVSSARRANATVFFITGAVFASFASRIPALQECTG